MISIIAAIAKNRAIGKNNQLLWNIKEDMQHFKRITTGHTVVMGMRTFQSIGRSLPNRRNIIITRDKEVKIEGCEIVNSFEEIMAWAKETEEEVFVIGGGQIYKLALPFADKLYLTIVDDAPEDADAFFPDYSEFKSVVSEEECDNGEYKFKFLELTK